ncbi:hypothetical protein Droror1_Dr00007249 [Drosera rotundifolia]
MQLDYRTRSYSFGFKCSCVDIMEDTFTKSFGSWLAFELSKVLFVVLAGKFGCCLQLGFELELNLDWVRGVCSEIGFMVFVLCGVARGYRAVEQSWMLGYRVAEAWSWLVSFGAARYRSWCLEIDAAWDYKKLLVVSKDMPIEAASCVGILVGASAIILR